MAISEIVIIITTCLALYGALLSTYNAYQKWNENKPKIKIETINRFNEELADDFYVIVAKNVGIKSVTMSYAYLEECKSGCKTEANWVVDGKILLSGQAAEATFEFPDDFGEFQRKHISIKNHFVGVFVDQIGNIYKSKPFTLKE